jgi:hypothetical protein
MSRTFWVLPFLCLLLLGMGAAGSAAAPARAAGCRTAGRTIDAGPGGRVFYRLTGNPDRVYLCSYGTGRRTPIGWDDCFNAAEVQLTRFSRRFLAADTFSCGPGGTASTLYLRRTRDGRRVRRVAAAAPSVPGSLADVTDLVLRGDGTMAWIVELRDSPAASPRYELRSSGSGASSSVLAQGVDIAPGSLALAGSTLYWTQAGAPQSAPL